MREATKEELLESLEETEKKLKIAIEIIAEKEEELRKLRTVELKHDMLSHWDAFVSIAESEIEKRYNHFNKTVNKGYF